MNDRLDVETLLDDWLRAEAFERADTIVLRRAMDRIATTDQGRPRLDRLFGDGSQRSTGLRLALVFAVVVIVVGTVLVFGPRRLGVGTPPIAPAFWTPERLAEDWPVPPRTEGLFAGDIPLVLGPGAQWDSSEGAWEGWEYLDPVGDITPDAGPSIDIRRVAGPSIDIRSVGFSTGRPEAFKLNVADDARLPVTDPADRWIAYGFVIDVDADGAPDLRLGMDNMPEGGFRYWLADLKTGLMTIKCWPTPSLDAWCGRTLGGPPGLVDAYYPYTWETWSKGPWFFYSGQPGRFYAWASLIEHGRVVATDYAPDTGWLVGGSGPGLPLVGPTWGRERDLTDSLMVTSTLTFTSDGRMLIDAGCNRGAAKVTIGPTTLQVSDLRLTDRMCSSEVVAFESEMRAVLAAEEVSYTIDRGTLELRADGHVLRLSGAFDDPPP